MTALYVDHMAYGLSASITGSISNGVLNIASIASGAAGLLAYISGGGLPAGVFITGQTSGSTGGPGNYNINNTTVSVAAGTALTLAEGYPYTVTPLTWGAPVDGDGLAQAASTASAIATIQFSALPTSGTISICGLTVSPTWSGDAADDLATAINAASGGITGITGSINGTPLYNFVYARGPALGSGTAGLCQIMTWAGSATFNGQTAIAYTLNNVTSATAFAGGVSGCWGYISNEHGMFSSAVAIGNYGILSNTQPYASSWASADIINMRSGKSLVSGQLTSSFTYGNWNGAATAAAPIAIKVDDGTIWTADGTTPQIVMNIGTNAGGNVSFGTYYQTCSYTHIRGQVYANGSYSMVFNIGSGGYTTFLNIEGGSSIVGASFVSNAGTSGAMILAPNSNISTPIIQTLYDNCKFSQPGNKPFMAPIPGTNGYQTYFTQFFQCVFDNTGNTGVNSGVIHNANSNSFNAYAVYMDSCVFNNFIGGSALFDNTSGCYCNSRQMIFRNCMYGGISVLGPYEGVTNNNLQYGAINASSTQYAQRNFFIDSCWGMVEWHYERSPPTASAVLMDGSTPWSIHMMPTTVAGRLNRSSFLESPRIAKINSLATAVRTLTISLAIHESLTWNQSNISALIDYVDQNGVNQTIDTFSWASAPLATSTATWSSQSGSQVTYVDGVTQYFNKYQIQVTLPTECVNNTELGIMIRVHTAVANSTIGLFFDPEIQVV